MAEGFFSKSAVVIAHRGDSIRFPENTMPAFKSAAEMGVDVIETDIHLSKDGKVVIWHDENLSRTADRGGLIADMTWEELQKVDAGYFYSGDGGRTFPFRGKKVKIALFRDLLRELPQMRFNVDLKADNPQLIEAFSKIIEEENAENRVIGASFHHKNLVLLRKRMPGLVTSFSPQEIKSILLQKISGILLLRKKFNAAVLQVPECSGKIRVVSKSLIKMIHKKGLKVQVWTVNRAEDMKRLLAMGVDGIFTDDPSVLQKVEAESRLF